MSQPPLQSPTPAAAEHKPVPAWHLHRRLYDWTRSLSRTRHATLALAFISFSESIWFPIPPDVLQVAMTLEQPRKAWWYATVNTVSSVLGGITGYYIGQVGLSVAHNAFRSLGWERVANFCRVETFAPLRQYSESLFMLTAGAVAIHPYKIFTIGAGALDVALASFVLASIIGRGPRFFIIAALLYFFGERAKTFIDKYFNLITLVVTVALLAAVTWIVLRKH